MIDKLVPIISSLSEPSDYDEKDHTWLSPLNLKLNSTSEIQLAQLIDRFMDESKKKTKEPHLSSLRRHWELILLNLSRAVFQRRWLLVGLDNRAFAEGTPYSRNGWSHGPTKRVIEHLEQQGLIHKHKGKKYNNPKRTRVFPTKDLAPLLYQFFLDTEQPIKPPYTTVNDPSDPWLDARNAGPSASDWEEEELAKINDFLRGHSWACKGPVNLLYKADPFSGGRLYTAYQNLPDRKARVRINTLIDGEVIAEVDFSANHLRLQLAVMHQRDAGDTPYEDIGAASGINDRDTIKAFITRAMGADNRDAAQNSCKTEGITNVMFQALEGACSELYPELQLFIGWTHQGQNLEGQILKKVMLKGVDEGVVCLPVHDAIAVQRRHESWAVKTMISTWTEVVGCDVKPRVKVDVA